MKKETLAEECLARGITPEDLHDYTTLMKEKQQRWNKELAEEILSDECQEIKRIFCDCECKKCSIIQRARCCTNCKDLRMIIDKAKKEAVKQ